MLDHRATVAVYGTRKSGFRSLHLVNLNLFVNVALTRCLSFELVTIKAEGMAMPWADRRQAMATCGLKLSMFRSESETTEMMVGKSPKMVT